MSAPGMAPDYIGPHEGRELKLMISGQKPLSIFVEEVSSELEHFPENEFDQLVSEGKLTKHVSFETIRGPRGKDAQVRRVLYALPGERWRIEAFLLVQNLYDSLAPGWRPDLDRVIGLLLGYPREDIERFLEFNGVAQTISAKPRNSDP